MHSDFNAVTRSNAAVTEIPSSFNMVTPVMGVTGFTAPYTYPSISIHFPLSIYFRYFVTNVTKISKVLE